MPMFWLPYENIRPYISNSYIMTSNMNKAMTFTMDDYFRRRMFEGDIIKTCLLYTSESIEHINSGLNRIREMYDGSVVDSSVFRNETEKMTRQLAELNQVYSRLLQAMTVNMGYQQPAQPQQQPQQPMYQQPQQPGYQQDVYKRQQQLRIQELELALRADMSNFWMAYKNNLDLWSLEKENLVAAQENYLSLIHI